MTATVAIRLKGKWRGPKYLLALPAIIWYVLFFALPIAFIVFYSFGTKDSTKLLPVDFGHLSTHSYVAVFDETFFKTFRGTLRISVIATAMCVLIGLPVAYFAAFKVPEKWKAIILAAVVVPSFTSFLIRTVAWRIPLAPNGTFSKWLVGMGWIGQNGIQILETSLAVQIAIVYNYLGFMILPLFVALDRIDVRMREASKDLGAGRLATFFGVTMPLAGPGIVAGVLLTFIPMCGDYVTATVLGGAKGNMIGAMIASQFSGAQNWPLGSAMAILMIGAVLLSLAAGFVVMKIVPLIGSLTSPIVQNVRRKIHDRALEQVKNVKPRTRNKIEILPKVLGAWTVLVLVFLFIPILLVFLHSFNNGGSFTIWSGKTSTKWWGELFNGGEVVAVLVRFALIIGIGVMIKKLVKNRPHVPRQLLTWLIPASFLFALILNGLMTQWYRTIFDFIGIGDAIRNSFIAAFGATVIAVIIGGMSGVALARRPGRWTTFFMATVFLILVTPEIMDAVALATWFPRIKEIPFVGIIFSQGWGPFNGGINKLWVGQSLYASAVVTLIVRARLAGIDESLEEAAGDLGAPPGRAFRQITLPLIASAMVAGGLLSFALCLDNAVISTLISEAGSTTFPVALLGATRSTIKPFWGVGAALLFIVTLSALWFLAVVLRRGGDSASKIAATFTGGS
ncbi:MAG: ABC transporter permease subunit [Actinobacteria bacterium]|nr:MAG: ABC transporter permease subunit [Actinomycetota bacterium]